MNCNYDGGHGFLPDSYVDQHIWFVYNYTETHSCDCSSDTRFIKTSSKMDCLEICDLTENCKFWSFEKNTGECLLKHRNSNPVENEGVISGNSKNDDSNFLYDQDGVEYVSDNFGY